MISRIGARLRWMRRKLSRAHWAARILDFSEMDGHSGRRGLILLQIDGLSRQQFDNAVAGSRLPFLRRMMRRESLHLHDFYSGVPSTTPAVQGELFYGVRGAVPAFQFVHRNSGKIFRMFDPEAADVIEGELSASGNRPLLTGGHCYSNIYRAGASRSRYCSGDLSAERIWRRADPLKWLILSVFYIWKILRMAGLALLELGLALVDCVRGVFERQDLVRELTFVPARVGVCILLREYIRFHVMVDIEKGVRVIQANFLGYDEQSHRRGPDSAFAHWTLKGIDRTIRDIVRAAARSDRRDYEVVVYSDHGQEKVIPFSKKTGRGLDEVARESFSDGPLSRASVRFAGELQKVAGRAGRARGTSLPSDEVPGGNTIVIAAMGPLAHLYLPEEIPLEWKRRYATKLVGDGLPFVFFSDGEAVHAINREGEWELPRDAVRVLGEGHPFLREVGQDLVSLARQPNSGDLIASGWTTDGKPLSFPSENGAHAGPGSEETRAFLLLPDALNRVAEKKDHAFRPEDFYRMVSEFLDEDRPLPRPVRPSVDGRTTIRVMTYNIHSCVGIDGRLRPERIARAINRFHPDIVAVQEVDAHRPRSGLSHQAEFIAEHLEFGHVFQSMLEEEEKYGIAIFSTLPFEVMRAGLLTPAVPERLREARGAIHVRLEIGGRRIHFINTHFGLGADERNRQAEVLLDGEWLGGIPHNEPVILCGDFNSTRRSVAWKRLNDRLPDIQRAAGLHRSIPTFPSIRPVAGLDHIFCSEHFEIRNVWVPGAHSVVMASDHLPLIADIEIRTPT